MQSKLDEQALSANKKIRERYYWQNRLQGFEYNSFFQDHAFTTNTGDRLIGRFDMVMPESASGRLAEIAASYKARQLVLMAVFGVLAGKCSSLTDVCVFTTEYKKQTDNLSNPEILPVRMTDFGKQPFSVFLELFKNDFAEDLKNAAYPIDKKLAVVSGALNKISPAGLLVEEIQDMPSADQLALDLIFSFGLATNRLSVYYQTAKFEAGYIERLARLYMGLLEHLLNNSRQLIEDVEMIPAEEKELILKVFNNTGKIFPAEKTIIDLFQHQVSICANNIAVQFMHQQLSYKQLDEQSNRVANYLLSRFDCRQKVIGVLLDRSTELMEALFGILKAGAIYLPLSKNYPEERTIFTLKDSGAQIVFTGENDLGKFPGHECLTVQMCEQASVADCNLAEPESLAYIIYTSGSTGKPKGVMIRHVSLVNRLHWMQEKYQLQPFDIILQKTPVVFDVSVWELFWWSLCGAKLVLAEPGAEKDPEQLCGIMLKEQVTVLHFVPSMLNIFLTYIEEYVKKQPLPVIRYLFSSGEELKPADAKKFFEYFPAAQLHNLYGPTEATVDVSYYEVLPSVNYQKIPIGKPVDNTQLYIFSREQHLQPIGLPGELYIGGINLSPGYLNREELTKEKFVLNPLDHKTILYKTGDLARWLPDGNIEYLGRIDNQVKIRGNRIEYGEIEFAMGTHHTVKNTVALAKETNGILQLVAYLVTAPGFSEEALFQHLAITLPDYMIPSYFILLNEIPVTVNGKADRNYLLSLKRSEQLAYAAPVTELEKTLAAQWCSILESDRVSIDDNFFRIGGDSIMAVKLIGFINNELGVHLSLSDLYAHKTIRTLATFIPQLGTKPFSEQQREIEITLERFQQNFLAKHPDQAIESVYPMSDMERSVCMSQLMRPDEGLYFKQTMQPVNYEHFNVLLLQQAVDMMVAKHEILRTGFNMADSAHIVYRDAKVKIELRDLAQFSYESQKREIRSYLEQSREKPFMPGTAPMWRLIVYRLAQDHHELLFEFHGVMLDGWSMNAFIAELNEVYASLRHNRETLVKPLAVSYKDLIAQELLHKQDAAAVQYWKKEMEGYRKLRLNNDTGPVVHKSVRQRSSAEWVARLEQTAKQENTTVKNILFAAYVYCMHILSGETDVLVGLQSFNRPLKKDGDQLLGSFLNVLPFRIQIPEATAWRQFQQRIDGKMDEIKKYETLSLFEINKAVTGSALPENQLFNTMFNYVRWRLMEKMQLESMNDIGVDRLDFDSFVRRSTSFDVNYNLNSERILNMHEYKTPFMNDHIFQQYTLLFNYIIETITENFGTVINSEALKKAGRGEELPATLAN